MSAQISTAAIIGAMMAIFFGIMFLAAISCLGAFQPPVVGARG